MKFAKAHGLGNDFILVAKAEAPADPAGAWASRICHRHVGVGGDGVILYEPVPEGVAMRLYNADGSEAEISGNGLRCLAAFAFARGLAGAAHVVRTAAGPRGVTVSATASGQFRIATDLGEPILDSERIPIALQPARATVIDHPLEAAGRSVRVTATSLGNPHCAVFFDDPASEESFVALGPALEAHPAFPRRTNVEFVTVRSRDELAVRFWERGVGPTSASGTGAASAAVAAILNGRTDRKVRVVCEGGTLEVEWPEGGHVHQTGDVELLFDGEWRPGPGLPREVAGMVGGRPGPP